MCLYCSTNSAGTHETHCPLYSPTQFIIKPKVVGAEKAREEPVAFVSCPWCGNPLKVARGSDSTKSG